MSVWDRKTGRYYLIDTTADESVFPASPTDRTWRQRNIIVHLGSRSFTQSFHITDVRQPILGADFLVSNNLTVDLFGRRLIDLFSYTIILMTATLGSASTESGQMTMTWPPFSMNSLNYWFHASMPLMKICME